MAVKTFSVGETLTASDTNTYLANAGTNMILTLGVTSVGGTAATAANGVVSIGTSNTSITVTSAFSSTYTRYVIIIDGAKNSVEATLKFQMGTTAANYYGSYYYDRADGGSTGTIRNNNDTFWWLAGIGTIAGENSVHIEVGSPNKAVRTTYQCQYSGKNFTGWAGGQLADTTQYTSFTIFPDAGSMTGGTIRVYGYRD